MASELVDLALIQDEELLRRMVSLYAKLKKPLKTKHPYQYFSNKIIHPISEENERKKMYGRLLKLFHRGLSSIHQRFEPILKPLIVA